MRGARSQAVRGARWLTVLCVCALLACRSSGPEPAEAPAAPAADDGEARAPADHDEVVRAHYTVRADEALTELDVRVCFSGRAPAALKAPARRLRDTLMEARDARGEALAMKDREVDTSSLEPDGCAALRIDVSRVIAASSSRRGRRLGRDVLLAPDEWLWRPSGAAEVTAWFELPPGIHASVPWPRVAADGPYQVPRSPWHWGNQGALGAFTPRALEVGGATLRVAILGSDWQVERALLLDWLRRAARATATLHGAFPVPEAQVILVPSAGARVGFGWATRGGGPSIAIHVGTEVTAEALARDWVAVHEMLHLGIPVVEDDARWLSEGLVTYYEPILRARAGLIPAADAWALLHDGFGRGALRTSGRTLRDESRDMDETRQYWRVYWSGAAIALLADVALRQRGGSLDDEMRALRRLALEADRTFTAEALFAALVSGDAPSALAQVSARFVHGMSFPDVAGAYEALGLVVDADGALSLAGDDAARGLREAITRAAQ